MRIDTTQSVYREHPGLDDDPEFEPEELVARIKALLLRATLHGAAPRIAFGRFELDVAARVLRAGGRPVDLTPREYALLEFFVLHPGQAFTRPG